MNNTIFWIIEGITFGTFFILGLYCLIRNKKEDKFNGKVYGKIINNIQQTEKTGDTYSKYWYSLCEYYVDETKCVRKTNYGTFQPKYEIGQTVEVYYNKDNCHESYIKGDKFQGNVVAIICFILGIFATMFVYFLQKQY